MKTGIKVGDVMTRNFVHANPETSLIECARNMIKKRVGSLILMEKNSLKGIITERDILWALIKKSFGDLKNIKAKQISARKIITISPSEDIFEALKKMKKMKFKWLPVVSEKKVVGMLTINDILRIEPTMLESAVEMFHIREETEKLKRMGSGRDGMCEECGNFDSLEKVDGRLICESCKDVM
jgi:CBS domain-containing protein